MWEFQNQYTKKIIVLFSNGYLCNFHAPKWEIFHSNWFIFSCWVLCITSNSRIAGWLAQISVSTNLINIHLWVGTSVQILWFGWTRKMHRSLFRFCNKSYECFVSWWRYSILIYEDKEKYRRCIPRKIDLPLNVRDSLVLLFLLSNKSSIKSVGAFKMNSKYVCVWAGLPKLNCL